MLKGTCCSCRKLGFGSQCPHGGSQQSLTLIPGDPTPSPDSTDTACPYIHASKTPMHIRTCKQNTYIHGGIKNILRLRSTNQNHKVDGLRKVLLVPQINKGLGIKLYKECLKISKKKPATHYINGRELKWSIGSPQWEQIYQARLRVGQALSNKSEAQGDRQK